MRRLVLITMAGLLVTSLALAEDDSDSGKFRRSREGNENARRPMMQRGEHGRGPGQRGGHRPQGSILEHIASNERAIKHLELTDEQIAQLKAKAEEFKKKFEALQKQLEASAEEQVKGLMEGDGNIDAALKKIEERGRIRTEMNKLHLLQMVALKDILTKEQLAKMKEAHEKRREQMEQMRERRGKSEEGRREGGGSQRRRHRDRERDDDRDDT